MLACWLRWKLLAGWLAIVVASAAPFAHSAEPKRPNILFLLADDQRADTIHALGNDVIQTPHLDRLVADGTSFSRAYCMGGTQPAVCVTSRAMLLGGRTLFRCDDKLMRGPTLPSLLQSAGYVTFGAGKWHNGQPSYARSFSKGGAIFFGGMTNQFHPPLFSFDALGTYENRRPRTSEKFSTEAIAEEAVRFLKDHRPVKPFFCYVSFTVPHDPRTPPGKYATLYNPLSVPLPKNFAPQHPFNNGEMAVRDEQLLPWPRKPEQVREELAKYYGLISHLDEQIGRILEALRETYLDENTIIVFASDQGLALGSHGLLGKQNLYEPSMRVPLIVAGTGIAKDKRVDTFCYLFDLFPTLCDLAGVKKPAELEGQSFAPLLTGQEQPAGRASIFTGYRDVQRAVRDTAWKLIRYPQINKSQLFHLAEDPDELHDLAAQPSRAAEVTRLTALLTTWQQQLGDTLPLTTDKPQPLEIKLGAASR